VLVDFEVYNAAGRKVWQSWQDKAALSGTAQTFTARWSVPASQAAGAYTLKIGVFSPGWGTLYAWDSAAATLTIG
jgi:hypothetical protein